VLLPGLGESPSSFVKQGTVEQVVACQPKANIIGIDSHFAYFRNRSIVARLHEDIIVPARQAGIQRVWLLGISLGGMGSLLYWRQYPYELAGVVVMAPYLGEWDELRVYLNDRDSYLESPDKDFLELWDGLSNPPAAAPEITLAYGETDKFNQQQRWLAGLLDRDKVITAAGGHRWTVWKTLWPEALKRSGLCDS
jgi:pimeloyl-ACP methyl ester carboxylesterase